jgi:thiol-disulfide isomerase/thioredoxin
MKKLFFIVIAIICSVTAFGQAKKQVVFEAQITNRNSDTIYVKNNTGFSKKIVSNKDGVFKDTFEVKDGMYFMNDGNESAGLYLKNGFDLKMKLDTKQFDETVVFTGKGEAENNFLAKRMLDDEKYFTPQMFELDETAFAKFIEVKKQNDLKDFKNKKLDPDFVILEKKNSENGLKGLQEYYKVEHAKIASLNKLTNAPAPSFDFVNYKGGKTKLEDFKGKYVYIDVWATWCGPCRGEIPFLQKTEKQYEGKNIAFVSISVDVQKDLEKWKTMIKDKELGGEQLIADNDFNSDFVKKFAINSIPRFILIDPAGKVVHADASRPSDPELQKELDSLLK